MKLKALARIQETAVNHSNGALVLNSANHPLHFDGKKLSLADTFTVFSDKIMAQRAARDFGDKTMRVTFALVKYD